MHDPETGLYLLGHRYYDPATGRFLNRDPIGTAGGENIYNAFGGNPVNEIDPEGTDILDDNANFWGGAGDALTFGATHWGRLAVGRLVGVGDANTQVDIESSSYKWGVGVETTVEVTATFGSSYLKRKLAEKVAEVGAKELGIVARRVARSQFTNLERAGKQVHHLYPLSGHPGGVKGLFPTGGLPLSINSARYMLKPLSKAAHLAAHGRLRAAESVLNVILNPYIVGARLVRNVRTTDHDEK